MGALRDQFLQYMRLKGFSPKTLESYERVMRDITRHYRVSPDTLSNAQIQNAGGVTSPYSAIRHCDGIG
jgi:hypothetical protein